MLISSVGYLFIVWNAICNDYMSVNAPSTVVVDLLLMYVIKRQKMAHFIVYVPIINTHLFISQTHFSFFDFVIHDQNLFSDANNWMFVSSVVYNCTYIVPL